MIRTGLAIVGLLAVSAGSAMAQSTRPDSAAVADMRVALRMVNGAQEVYYSRHNTYATEFSQLEVRPGMVAKEVTVRIRSADTRGWNGEATHSGLAGRSCVTQMGAPDRTPVVTLRDRLSASERPGRVRCDGDTSGS